MLGYMTKKEALAAGFTHHGSYYGIPLWITDDACPMVATKWEPLEILMSALHVVEGLIRSTFYPDEMPGFAFYIGPPID